MFYVNRIPWEIALVNPYSNRLMRSDGSITLGATDINDHVVYLSDQLKGQLLIKVLTHEMCHVYAMSYNYYMDVRTEEIVADFLSLYGKDVINATEYVLGHYIKMGSG